jgi:hypothetical protein
MAPKRTPKVPKTPPRPAVRDAPQTTLRLPPELRERLDVVSRKVNERLAREHGAGVSISRSALMLRALDEWSRAELARLDGEGA